MARQSALPGVMVEEIQVQKPPIDEPGVIQEFVGKGMTREFETLKKANEITEDTIGEILDSAEDMIGPLRDTYQIQYTLLIRAVSGTAISKRGAKARARAFTRAKNPFEPDVVEVRRASVDEMLSGGTVGTVYRVTTAVTK